MNDKLKLLLVSTPQGDAGDLHRGSQYAFNYTTARREAEASLVMPIRFESYTSQNLPIVFAMNRPEGDLLSRLQQKFAKAGGLTDMQLLALLGHNQIGRLTYSDPRDATIKAKRPEIGLGELLQSHPTESLFDFLVNTYIESGISGVQPKVLIPDKDRHDALVERSTVMHSTLIVKAGGDDFPCLTQNEFLCMEAARESGIRVPNFWLSDDGGLFIMERFDLVDGKSIGFEDMTVLTGRVPEPSGNYKYQGSYEGVSTAIQLTCRDNGLESKQRLYEYVALSVMVRNGDAHLKNFGVLYEHPVSQKAPELAPLYDVVTTSVYEHEDRKTGRSMVDRTMALKLNKDNKYPTRQELLAFGSSVCGVAKPEQVIDRIGTAMTKVLDQHQERVEPTFFAKLKTEWDAGRFVVEPTRVYVPEQLKSGRGGIAEGSFSGPMISAKAGLVLQKTGRDASSVVEHAAERLSRVPAIGEVVDIKYINGVGKVSAPEIDKDKER